MRYHVLGVAVGDGRQVSEATLLTKVVSETKTGHLDGELLQFGFSEIVCSVLLIVVFFISICVYRCFLLQVFHWRSSSGHIRRRCGSGCAPWTL